MAAGGPDAAAEIAGQVRAAHPEQAALDVAGITSKRLEQKAATPERYKEAHEELIQKRGEITQQKVQEAKDKVSSPNQTAVEDAGNRIADFLDGKIVAGTPEHTFIIEQVYHALSKDPHHARKLPPGIIDPAGDKDVVAYIETILHDKNSRYELFLVRNAGAALEMSEQIDPALLQEIQAKKEAADLAKAERDRREADFTAADTAFKAVESQLDDYDHTIDATTNQPIGTKAQRIEELRTKKPQLEVDRDAGQRKLKIAEDRLQRLKQIKEEYDKASANDRRALLLKYGLRDRVDSNGNTTATVDAVFLEELKKAEDTVTDIYEKAVKPHEIELKELEHLETEEKRLRKEHRERKEERDEAAAEHQKAEADYQDKKSKHTEAENRKKDIEKTIISELEGVFGRAAREYTLDFVKVYTDALFEDLENFKKIVPDKHMQTLVSAIQKNMFHEQEVKTVYGPFGLLTRTRKEQRVDKKILDKHIKDIQDKPFDKFVVDLLAGTTPLLNPETGANYTQAEVRSLLAKKEFVEAAGDQIFKTLLVAGELSETGLDEAQLFALSRLPQGAGMLTRHMDADRAFRQEIDKKAKEGDKDGTFEDAPDAEKARRAIAMEPMILMMLLGNTFSQLAAEEEAEGRR